MKTLNSKNAQAFAVLAALYFRKPDEMEKVIVDDYENGRESGFSIQVREKKIAFSEFRRNDNIVLYVGNAKDFDSEGIPSEECYDQRRFSAPLDVNNAADFIIQFLW